MHAGATDWVLHHMSSLGAAHTPSSYPTVLSAQNHAGATSTYMHPQASTSQSTMRRTSCGPARRLGWWLLAVRFLLARLFLLELGDVEEESIAAAAELYTIEHMRVVTLRAAKVDAAQLAAKARIVVPALRHIALIATVADLAKPMLLDTAAHCAQHLLLQLPISKLARRGHRGWSRCACGLRSWLGGSWLSGGGWLGGIWHGGSWLGGSGFCGTWLGSSWLGGTRLGSFRGCARSSPRHERFAIPATLVRKDVATAMST